MGWACENRGSTRLHPTHLIPHSAKAGVDGAQPSEPLNTSALFVNLSFRRH
jgi:hypothetical protein